MSRVSITKTKLDALANAVSAKSGEALPLTIDEMTDAVEGIQTGGTPTLQSKSVTPTESAQTVTPDSGYDGLDEVTVGAISSTYVGSGIARRTSYDLEEYDNVISVPPGFYKNSASKGVYTEARAIPSISVSNTGLITATTNQSGGWVYAGTETATQQLTTQSATTITPSTSQQTAVAAGRYTTGAVTVAAIPSQYIVPSGTLSITQNGTVDVTNYASASVNVAGGSVQTDTKTVTASNYPVSLSFTSMKGEPKAFVVRLNTSVSSSGNTTYYYIVEIAAFGSTTHGNCFRVGGTRQVTNLTTGYSWSYSGTTLTITSSAQSRSASPGAFYSGSYELMYIY